MAAKTVNQLWLEGLGKTANKVNYDDIEKWCIANGEDKIRWLIETSEKKTTIKVYPRKSEEYLDENGKKRKRSVADKNQPPVEKETNYTFPMIRKEFFIKWMPELLKDDSESEPTMKDRLAALKAKLN